MCHCALYVVCECAQRDAGICHEDLLLLKQMQKLLVNIDIKNKQKMITGNAHIIRELILLSLPSRLLKVLSEHAMEC